MKLVSLNTWGGRLFNPLKDFINKQKSDTDIFCFQEVFNSEGVSQNKDFRVDLLKDFEEILEEFEAFYSPASKNHDLSGKVDYEIYFGQATFIRRKAFKVKNIEEIMLLNEKFGNIGEGMKQLPKNMQILEIEKEDETLNVFNLHGQWYPGNKQDTDKRIAQSEKILEQVNKKSGRKIICGDFNLYPDTKSIKILEEAGLINLIKKFQIKTTRVKNFNKHGGPQFWADYTYVSPDINVKSFEVPNIEISDHLPMILEFE